jgi:hypothetical protein
MSKTGLTAIIHCRAHWQNGGTAKMPNPPPAGENLSPLANVSSGELADGIGALEARVEVLKAEAIRRDLHRAEGENCRIVLTRPAPLRRAAPGMALTAPLPPLPRASRAV